MEENATKKYIDYLVYILRRSQTKHAPDTLLVLSAINEYMCKLRSFNVYPKMCNYVGMEY